MNTKKLGKFTALTGIAILAAGTAHAAAFNIMAICPLIEELKNVFNVLRILAFVGAAFVLAAVGWEAIVTKDWKWEGQGKTKLIAMLVGFALLFSVGVIIQFLTSNRAGCNLGSW